MAVIVIATFIIMSISFLCNAIRDIVLFEE